MDPKRVFSETEAQSSAGLTRRDVLQRAGGGAALALTGSSLLAACGGSSSSSPGSTAATTTAKRGGDLKIAFVGEGQQETLDPGLQVASIDAARAANLFDTLFRVQPGNVLSHELAESFEPNSNATEWTARLRSGVRWHDGKPLTADDLIYTIRRVTAPHSKFTAAASLLVGERAGNQETRQPHRADSAPQPRCPVRMCVRELKYVRRPERRKGPVQASDRHWSLHVQVVHARPEQSVRSQSGLLEVAATVRGQPHLH